MSPAEIIRQFDDLLSFVTHDLEPHLQRAVDKELAKGRALSDVAIVVTPDGTTIDDRKRLAEELADDEDGFFDWLEDLPDPGRHFVVVMAGDARTVFTREQPGALS